LERSNDDEEKGNRAKYERKVDGVVKIYVALIVAILHRRSGAGDDLAYFGRDDCSACVGRHFILGEFHKADSE
jgi:hypothetical protein